MAQSAPDIQSLISQLTLEQKASLLAGKNFWETVPIPELNIPSLKVSDGPNGARGETFEGGVKSACFPASVCLAATWDLSLAKRIGKALAEEAKTKGALVLLGPTVCPHRHPLGGRNFESFSEDPLLAGLLASEYIIGLQEQGVGATIKHFAGNEQEIKRLSINAVIGQRALREIYLKPFEIAIKSAKPWAVMTSYNLVNGTHADMHEFLLQDVLRKQWGWEGLVMSDWGGTNSLVESLNAGLDLEMPGPAAQRQIQNVVSAVHRGDVSVETLNQRATAVLELVRKTGKFEDPTTPAEKAVDVPEHRQLIRQTGAAGIVLLKNDNNILPLQKEKLKSVAMLGVAKECLAHGGGSAQVNAHYKVTPWDAFEAAFEGKVDMKYAEGARLIRNLPPMQNEVYDESGAPGWTVTTYSGDAKKVSNSPVAVQKDLEDRKCTRITLSGVYKPTKTGSHYISFSTFGNTSVKINDEVIFKVVGQGADPMAFLMGVAGEEKKQYDFTAGQEYKIFIDSARTEDDITGISVFASVIGFIFGFMLQEIYDADLLRPAVEAAKASDVALVFVGHTPVWETEGTDRQHLELPNNGSLDRLITAAAEANPNTIVINSTGSPIAMPWLSKVRAVIQAWLPGQEAGNSIADVILGIVNPSGKLPVTFPNKVEDTPAHGNFPGDLTKLEVHYKEGIYIGYKHHDKNPSTILFPFGFGLSYTTFQIFNIKLSSSSSSSSDKQLTSSPSSKITITATVTNTGKLPGEEVIQIYTGPSTSSSSSSPESSSSKEEGKVDKPIKQLSTFTKTSLLQPSTSETIEVSFGKESIAYWNENVHKWSVDEGKYTVFVGTSSRDIVGTVEFEVVEGFEFDP